MSELRPILLSDPSEDDLRLLGSTRLDVPPPGGKSRVLLAMGLGVQTAAAATGTASVSAVKIASTGVIAKWLAIGALAGATTTTSVELVQHHMDKNSRSPDEVRPNTGVSDGRVSNPRRAVNERLPSTLETPAAPAATDEPGMQVGNPPVGADRAPDDQRRSRSVPSDARTASDTNRPLTAEIGMLDDAKHALSHGDPGRALSILDEFDREFRGARLGPEAAVLRVEALFDLGRNDEARRLGQRLIASQPDSAHVQRLRSLLEAAQAARGNAIP